MKTANATTIDSRYIVLRINGSESVKEAFESFLKETLETSRCADVVDILPFSIATFIAENEIDNYARSNIPEVHQIVKEQLATRIGIELLKAGEIEMTESEGLWCSTVKAKVSVLKSLKKGGKKE